ncbi:MAG: DsbE family thiol:disulfide interchange protein [Burkholderiales bacterium]
MSRFLLPLAIFVVVVAFLAVGLNLNPSEVPSPLVGRAAPEFQLPQLNTPAQAFGPEALKGEVWLLNVWASWCVSCRDEHPLLLRLAKDLKIVGLNYKDQRADALAWLKRFGDPYVLSVSDVEGKTGIDYGVYGVPETYVIDRQGVVRYKHIGPITQEAIDNQILPLVKKLDA